MAGFLARRAAEAALSLLGVLTLIFFVLQLSGDLALLMVPAGAAPAEIEAVRRALGLDRPLPVQYLAWLGDLLRFDLGRSLTQHIPVLDIILSRLPYTLQLAGAALLVAVGLGVPAGVALALWRGSWKARILSALVLAGQSMPSFWSGILLILLFAVALRWLPPSGAMEPGAIVMPALALGFLSMATFARVTRTAVLEELSRDYVRTARAKGLAPARIIARHVARNAAIPVITIAAIEIANLLTGAIVVETVFAWPGLGQVTIQAIAARDFPVVQGVVFVGALAAILLNLAADLLYAVVDPRIRLGGGRPA